LEDELPGTLVTKYPRQMLEELFFFFLVRTRWHNYGSREKNQLGLAFVSMLYRGDLSISWWQNGKGSWQLLVS
jgi:hypothetical protein